VRFGLTGKRIFSTLAIAVLLLGAFLFGFVSSHHLKGSITSDLRQQYQLQAGDAPASVRTEVLVALNDFQQGYVRRDPKDLDAFMNRLFPRNNDVQLLGTDAGEWVRGYSAVAEFIRADWLNWGDFRFAVDDSIICSSGDVAWITSVGVMRDHGVDHPLRFSAVLTRNGSNWVFRQVHFQWDARDPGVVDLLRPRTQLKLFRWVFQSIRRIT
jgi:hypothetical protein